MSSMATKLVNTAEVASSDAQTLVADMRKAIGTMKSLAVDFERDGKSDKVKKLEEMVLEMVASYEDCAAMAQAIKAVPGVYQPSDQPTDFKTLIEAEVSKIKGASSASHQNHPLLRQFRESVWNVHHAGQPMPGEEQEDIVMTSTQMSILNVTCPLTGKPVIELIDPVRCYFASESGATCTTDSGNLTYFETAQNVDCKHIYEKDPVMHYIKTQKPPQCPIAGCPRVLERGKVICDPLLRIEIEELRSSETGALNATNIDDLTELIDDDEE